MQNITICLIACGEATEGDCRAALKDNFVFQEVINVTPQASANNQMVRQCRTEFLVPVDADMILYRGYPSRIMNAIERYSNENWYQILFPLWDCLFEKSVLALKVNKTIVLQENCYHDIRVQDIEHFRRMKKMGYHVINLKDRGEKPIGDHVVVGAKSCYLRMKDIYLSHRYYGLNNAIIIDKAKNDYKFFLSKYHKTKNDDYLYCIAGMYDGLINATDMDKSKSFDEIMQFDPLEAIWMFQNKFMRIILL
jgi:hypothetical protein